MFAYEELEDVLDLLAHMAFYPSIDYLYTDIKEDKVYMVLENKGNNPITIGFELNNSHSNLEFKFKNIFSISATKDTVYVGGKEIALEILFSIYYFD